MEHLTARIIFYGTPEIAKASLEAMVDAGYRVVCVVTAPDRPAGRGLKLRPSAVKEFALSRGLRVLQPEKLNDPVFLEELKALDPDLQVVVAFRILPRSVWSRPRLGTFNLHASLLPQYRGAAPINWAIINGETKTGMTTFFLQDKVDTGDIIFREEMEIGPGETAGQLHDRMKVTGAHLVLRTIDSILAGTATSVNQAELLARLTGSGSNTLQAGAPAIPLKPAPKIHTGTCRINWDMPSASIINLIRGLSPVPGAFTELKMQDGSMLQVKIFKAVSVLGPPSSSPGEVSSDFRDHLSVSCPDAEIVIQELQPAGRKPMKTGEFLRGVGRQIAAKAR
jgi:methionyl-tRNA formyltransferase